jgi:hypothetical protein
MARPTHSPCRWICFGRRGMVTPVEKSMSLIPDATCLENTRSWPTAQAICAKAWSPGRDIGARCPVMGMYDTWINGSDVNSFCCYGFVYLLDSW